MNKLLGIEPVEPESPQHVEFPKWVKPHESHIGGGKVHGFAAEHVDRDGTVTVLVHNEDEEERALEPKDAPKEGSE